MKGKGKFIIWNKKSLAHEGLLLKLNFEIKIVIDCDIKISKLALYVQHLDF